MFAADFGCRFALCNFVIEPCIGDGFRRYSSGKFHAPRIEQGNLLLFIHGVILLFCFLFARFLRGGILESVENRGGNFLEMRQIQAVSYRDFRSELIAVTFFEGFIAIHELLGLHVGLNLCRSLTGPLRIHRGQRAVMLFEPPDQLVDFPLCCRQFLGVAGDLEQRRRAVPHPHCHLRHETKLAGLEDDVSGTRGQSENLGIDVAVSPDHFSDGETVPDVAAARVDIQQSAFSLERLDGILKLFRGESFIAVIIGSDLAVDRDFEVVIGGYFRVIGIPDLHP